MATEVKFNPNSKLTNGLLPHADAPSSNNVNPKFLVSFLVDARGGAMYGRRHSGVDIIIPPSKVCMPTRLTCRLLKKEKIPAPPQLNEEDAFASRFLQLGPVGIEFIGPVLIELPHFASRLNTERELVIMKSDDGKIWNEHKSEVPSESFEKFINETDKDNFSDRKQTAKIYTTTFPKYFVAITRVKQASKQLNKPGGNLHCSTANIEVPNGSVNKDTKITLEVIPVTKDTVNNCLNHGIETSYIISIQPLRRKFHQPITVSISVTKELQEKIRNSKKGASNSSNASNTSAGTNSSNMPVLLLYSITGGNTPASWEDITNSVVYSINKDIVSFNTAVSARYWLIENNPSPQQTIIQDAKKIYQEAIAVPFYATFYVLAKRQNDSEYQIRVLCMDDDGDVEQTLEHEEHFVHLATSQCVEVLQGKAYHVEISGNIVPSVASSNQLYLIFRPFRVNRLSYIARVRNPAEPLTCTMVVSRDSSHVHAGSLGRPLCSFDVLFPYLGGVASSPMQSNGADEVWEETFQKVQQTFASANGGACHNNSTTTSGGPEGLRLQDIAEHLKCDWVELAGELGVTKKEIARLMSEYGSIYEQAILMLHLWLDKSKHTARASQLENALKKIGRDDIIDICIKDRKNKTDTIDVNDDHVHPIDESYHEYTGFPDLKQEQSREIDDSFTSHEGAKTEEKNNNEYGGIKFDDGANKTGEMKPPKVMHTVPSLVEEPDSVKDDPFQHLEPQPKVEEVQDVEIVLADGSVVTETVTKEILEGHIDNNNSDEQARDVITDDNNVIIVNVDDNGKDVGVETADADDRSNEKDDDVIIVNVDGGKSSGCRADDVIIIDDVEDREAGANDVSGSCGGFAATVLPSLEITEVLNENIQDENIVIPKVHHKTKKNDDQDNDDKDGDEDDDDEEIIVEEVKEVVLEDGVRVKVTKIKEIHTARRHLQHGDDNDDDDDDDDKQLIDFSKRIGGSGGDKKVVVVVDGDVDGFNAVGSSVDGRKDSK